MIFTLSFLTLLGAAVVPSIWVGVKKDENFD